MPFLHLPIQSGSNKILKKMNRNHTKSDYINLVKRIKSKIRDMAFSSDFIVGYPGESDDDFNQTLDLRDVRIILTSHLTSSSFTVAGDSGQPENEISNDTLHSSLSIVSSRIYLSKLRHTVAAKHYNFLVCRGVLLFCSPIDSKTATKNKAR